MFSEKFGVFVNDVTKFVWVLMIDVCIKCSEITGTYGCIFVCIVVQDCRHSGVTQSGLFVWCLHRRRFAIIQLFVFVQIKDINTEIHGWIVIILMFMSVQIIYQNFPAGFVPCIEFIAWMHNYFWFLEANGCFVQFILYQSRYIYGKIRYTLSAGLVKIVFWNALYMSKTKRVRPSVEASSMVIRRGRIPATGA